MPMARPTIEASAKGVLKTLVDPYFRCNPAVALKTPPFPFTSFRFSSRLASATSSPKNRDPFVARHFVVQCRRHHLHHRFLRAVQLGLGHKRR
jgi:hypothetical protein